MSSTRLPGKVLADVGGEPMVALVLRRVRGARHVGPIMLATSTSPSDDPLEEVAVGLADGVVRGPLQDVRARYLMAIGDDDRPVVRITADCPLIDPAIIDAVIERFVNTPDCAYASNTSPRTYPDGLDVEVFAPAALRAAVADQEMPGDREHVTPALRRDPKRFPAVALIAERDLGHLRWTVDTPQDLEFVRAVVARLGSRRTNAGMEEMLAAIQAAPRLPDDEWPRG